MEARRLQPARRKSRERSLPPPEYNDGDAAVGDSDDIIERQLREALGSDSDTEINHVPSSGNNRASCSDEATESIVTERRSTRISGSKSDTEKGLEDPAVDDSSDSGVIDGDQVIRKKKGAKQREKNKKKVSIFGSVTSKHTTPLTDLLKLPTEMKEITDHLSLPTRRFLNMRQLEIQEVKTRARQLLVKGKTAEALTFLIHMLKLPEKFWYPHQHKIKWNYEIEEVGLLCLQIIEEVITNKHLMLEVVGKVGKISSSWRFKRGYGRGPNGENIDKMKTHKLIPKTFTRCAEILLAAGDMTGLSTLFSDFSRNIRNVMGEKSLLVLQVMSTMLERRTTEEETMSSISGVTGGSGRSTGLASDALISQARQMLIDNEDGDVEWIVPILSWYIMDERSADDVVELLKEFRDLNPDHFPAHEPLINFLIEEYGDEEELISKHLHDFCVKFPWDDRVLIYVEMIIKRSEEDNSGAESFDDDNHIEEQSQDKRQKECFLTALPFLIEYLDYEVNISDVKSWELLAHCLHMVVSDNSGRETVIQLLRSDDRVHWWIKQNFSLSGKENSNLLASKGRVALILLGSSSNLYTTILGLISDSLGSENNRIVAELKSWENMVKEPLMEENIGNVQFYQHFLQRNKRSSLYRQSETKFPDVDSEWAQLKERREYAKEERNKKHF